MLIGGTTVASFFAYSAKQQTLETHNGCVEQNTAIRQYAEGRRTQLGFSFERQAWSALAGTRENLRKWEYDYVLNRFLSNGTTLLADVERFVLRPDRVELVVCRQESAVSEHILGSVNEKFWPYQTLQPTENSYGANLISTL